MKKRKNDGELKSWMVTMECKVTKAVVCENCTREEAEANPFKYATSEMETDMVDWDVKSVEEND